MKKEVLRVCDFHTCNTSFLFVFFQFLRYHILCLQGPQPGSSGVFGGGGEQHVAAAVQGRFTGVFDDADDEAHAHHLHGDVIADAERGTGHGDQQQGTPGHPGSPAGPYGGNDAQQQGRGQVNSHAQGMGGGQAQHRNGDGGPGHVDGGPQGNGDGVGIRVQPQPFAQGQVHRDVGGGRTGEESVDAAFPDGGPHQGVGVLPYVQVHDDGVHHQGHQEIGTQQHAQQAEIGNQGGQAAGADGLGHQAHDPQRSEMDHPGDHFGDAGGQVFQHMLGFRAGRLVESQADDHRPGQDADVVGVQNGIQGIVHDVQHQVVDHFRNAAGGIHLGISQLEHQGLGEQEGQDHAHDGSGESTDYIQGDDGLHLGVAPFFPLDHGVHHQDEYQQGSHPFQGPDEQVAEDANHGHGAGEEHGNQDADDETNGDLVDQRDFTKCADHRVHTRLPF